MTAISQVETPVETPVEAPLTGRPSEETVRWARLLETALTVPGVMSTAYRAFHRFSTGNQMLAWAQCMDRQEPVGPLATFKAWQAKGRQVRRGSKAIVLCMPITCKREDKATGDVHVFRRFTYKANWFTVHQTDGEDTVAEDFPTWDRATALAALDIREEVFNYPNGNAQGYATQGRVVAINPVAVAPFKTLAHELAHIVLGHLDEMVQGSEGITPQDIRELEAEATAMLVCDSLGIDNLSASRAYCQNWYSGKTVPEKSATRIFSAANKILCAGKPASATQEEA